MKLIIIIIFFALALAFGQGCFVELSQSWSEEELAGQITNIEAGFLLKLAVDLLEPNLPQITSVAFDFDLDLDDENYELIRFLIERDLMDYQDDLEQENIKQSLINRLRAWYSLPAIEVESNLTRLELIQILTNTISVLDLDPVALISSGNNKDKIGLLSIIRNDSIYPRMIIFRAPNFEELNLRNGVNAVINYLDNCAYKVDKYIFSSADTAKQLFLSNFDSRMIIVDSSPNILDGYLKVEQGQETDYFSFISEDLNNVSSFAAVFTEQEIKPLKIMRLLPRVRTNMNPKQILNFLQGQ